ncbi:MAG: DUF4397 domain-containing protein [Cellulosilyticaceae bacterium]
MKKNPIPSCCYLRVFHAYPTQTALSLTLADQTLANDLFYEDFTQYIPLEPETYPIKVFPYKEDSLLAQVDITLHPYKIYTLVLAPHPKALDKLHLYCIEDIQRLVNPPDCVLRMAHFVHTINAFDLLEQEDRLRFKNIHFSEVSRYIPFDSTPNQFKWIDHSYKEQLLELSHQLKPIRLYTFYLIGNNTKAFPLKCVVSIDGNSYLPTPLLEKKEKRAD